MTATATGIFEVRMTPVPPTAAQIGNMTLAKSFHGDLEATGVGHMLAVQTAVAGSAGYVAMEQVDGTLRGRHGTFVLQHSGTMRGDHQALSITVVPDSGTGALAGIGGKMTIAIENGVHRYTFDYTLPSAK